MQAKRVKAGETQWYVLYHHAGMTTKHVFLYIVVNRWLEEGMK
jgi:hypothetical protein